MAEQILLAEADDFDPGRSKPRIDWSSGGENDRTRAGALQTDRTFNRHLRLSAGNRGMIQTDHDR